MEKYNLFKHRNESLEKTAVEKENLYTDIKLQNDQIANTNYKLQRQNEELSNQTRI